MNVFSIFAQTTLLTCTLVGATALQASVIINSTRVVYPQNDKEVTVRLESKNQAPVLVQTWLDNGDEQSTPQVGGIPFVVTPPIFRMEPGKQQVVRVAYTGWKCLRNLQMRNRATNCSWRFARGSNCSSVRITCSTESKRHPENCNGDASQAHRARAWKSSTRRPIT